MARGLLGPHVSLTGGTYKKSGAWEWELELGKPRGVIGGFGRRHRKGSFLLRFLPHKPVPPCSRDGQHTIELLYRHALNINKGGRGRKRRAHGSSGHPGSQPHKNTIIRQRLFFAQWLDYRCLVALEPVPPCAELPHRLARRTAARPFVPGDEGLELLAPEGALPRQDGLARRLLRRSSRNTWPPRPPPSWRPCASSSLVGRRRHGTPENHKAGANKRHGA